MVLPMHFRMDRCWETGVKSLAVLCWYVLFPYGCAIEEEDKREIWHQRWHRGWHSFSWTSLWLIITLSGVQRNWCKKFITCHVWKMQLDVNSEVIMLKIQNVCSLCLPLFVLMYDVYDIAILSFCIP